MYAIRYVFDREVRRNGFLDADFYQKETENNIEILITIDISDFEDIDNQKLRAQLKGNILSNQTLVYIKLEASYSEDEMLDYLIYTGEEICIT